MLYAKKLKKNWRNNTLVCHIFIIGGISIGGGGPGPPAPLPPPPLATPMYCTFQNIFPIFIPTEYMPLTHIANCLDSAASI